MEIREYLVRTPDGHDYGRDVSRTDSIAAADRLGTGATVIALNDLLLPLRDDSGAEVVVHVAGASAPARTSAIACPYARCRYQTTDEADLEEHLLAMPTEAPEHAWDHGELPRRVPGMFVRHTASA